MIREFLNFNLKIRDFIPSLCDPFKLKLILEASFADFKAHIRLFADSILPELEHVSSISEFCVLQLGENGRREMNFICFTERLFFCFI